MWLLVFQRLVVEFLFDIIYFPIWWYTGGIKHTLVYCYHLLQSGNNYLAPGLWLKNIFVPMFGQYDFGGRMVSLFMRSVNVIGRSFALFIWLLVVLFIFILWLVIPFLVVYMLYRSLV